MRHTEPGQSTNYDNQQECAGRHWQILQNFSRAEVSCHFVFHTVFSSHSSFQHLRTVKREWLFQTKHTQGNASKGLVFAAAERQRHKAPVCVLGEGHHAQHEQYEADESENSRDAILALLLWGLILKRRLDIASNCGQR